MTPRVISAVLAAGFLAVIPTQSLATASSVTATMPAQQNYHGVCPQIMQFMGRVVVTGQVDAKSSFSFSYQFTRDDGTVGPATIVKVDHPGNFTVFDQWPNVGHSLGVHTATDSYKISPVGRPWPAQPAASYGATGSMQVKCLKMK